MSKKIRKKTPAAKYSYYWLSVDGTYSYVHNIAGGVKLNWDKFPVARVWRQGPKGGVKVMHDSEFALYGYITRQPQAMVEFERAKTMAILSS